MENSNSFLFNNPFLGIFEFYFEFLNFEYLNFWILEFLKSTWCFTGSPHVMKTDIIGNYWTMMRRYVQFFHSSLRLLLYMGIEQLLDSLSSMFDMLSISEFLQTCVLLLLSVCLLRSHLVYLLMDVLVFVLFSMCSKSCPFLLCIFSSVLTPLVRFF